MGWVGIHKAKQRREFCEWLFWFGKSFELEPEARQALDEAKKKFGGGLNE